ncbi:protein Niban 1-like [Solea solea]|uniref:protein Niban 1-like n=1 Tax=Solea solea TaxID=90069 RepID=UPI00272CEEF5|nr:protein Niban 1-like [Solea solea]
MGASSSGLLDEAKISHIKGLVDSKFQSFSDFYRQQYGPAYFGHLHQEVEPKKEGCGLLLTQRPRYNADEVLYQGNVRFSCWYEHGKKCRERYVVLRRDYSVEIHDNVESFNHKSAAKLVLQPAGGSVLITGEESRTHLEQICAGILNGAKDESSSSVVSSPEVPAVYLHLPYAGYTCFLFQQEEERDHFLSAIKSCIRHCNLDPWCESTYESQAYIRALRLYRQANGCYESWEMLLGTEEQVLASQVMEEVLPWLQSQLQSRVKGKKGERMRQWLATVHATYTMVLAQLTASLDALKEKCRQTALADQTLIRSNLDQIVSSLSFLEEKVRVCICDEAEGLYSESVAPYLSSIFEVLAENISAGIQGMQHTLHTQMDSVFTHAKGTEETNKVLLTLRSISLEPCYRQVKNLTEILGDLQQRFGLSSTQRLVHSAHLEMEQLADSAVYTLELFLKSSAKLQSSQVLVKMKRAKDRVLKQLDYDSRLVQRRLYQEALLEITLPVLARRMDSRWKNELQQLEQYIFSDYSSFILIHNVYDDVLRNILSAQIETVIHDGANKKSNNRLLDISDLAISEYSLLGQSPPCSAPDSPANHGRNVPTAMDSEKQQSAPEMEGWPQTVTAHPQTDPELQSEDKSVPSSTQGSDQNRAPLSPTIVTQEFEEPAQTDTELHSEDKSDHSSTQGIDQNTAPLSKVIVVTQEFDEPAQTDPELQSEDKSDPSSTQGSVQNIVPLCSAIVVTQDFDKPAQINPELHSEDKSDPSTTQGVVQNMVPLSNVIVVTQEFEEPAQTGPELHSEDKSDPSTTQGAVQNTAPLSPVIVVTQEFDDLAQTGPELHSEDKSDPSTTQGAVQNTAPLSPVIVVTQEFDDLAQTGPELHSEDKSDPSTTQGADQNTAPLCPAIVVTQEFDEFANEEASPSKEPNNDVQPRSDTPSMTDSSTADSETPDLSAIPESTNHILHSPSSSVCSLPSSQSSDQHANLDQTSEEDAASVQPFCPSPPSDTDSMTKMGLESVSEKISCDTTATQMMAQRMTDRAVYLTGQIRNSWEAERVKEETQKETEAEDAAGRRVAYQEKDSEAEKTTDDVGGAEEQKEEPMGKAQEEEEEVEEQLVQNPQLMESQSESSAELPLDSVAMIRDLVTEITEVEIIVRPCPDSSNTQ